MDPVMAFPFAGYGVEGVFNDKPVDQVYETAIRNILMTEKRTVPWDLEFGSRIRSFVFDLNDVISQNLILYYAFEDIQEQEPRLRLVDLAASFDVDNYRANFTVAFIAFDDPSETVRVAKVNEIEFKRQTSRAA